MKKEELITRINKNLKLERLILKIERVEYSIDDEILNKRYDVLLNILNKDREIIFTEDNKRLLNESDFKIINERNNCNIEHIFSVTIAINNIKRLLSQYERQQRLLK